MYLEVTQVSQKRELKPFFRNETAFSHPPFNDSNLGNRLT